MITILIISIGIQTLTAFFALKLIKTTGKANAWAIIASATVLMALRRIVTLHNLIFRPETFQPVLINEIIALITSAMMLIGIIWINPLFNSIKLTNQALQLSNRALRTLSECNQAIVRITDEQQLMNEICRIIVDVGGYEFAWVGWGQDDPEKSVKPEAMHGNGVDYLKNIFISWDDNENGRGPTGIAIRTGEISVTNQISKDPNYRPWRLSKKELPIVDRFANRNQQIQPRGIKYLR
jgi:K+-sensing histidine kinase KdpD